MARPTGSVRRGGAAAGGALSLAGAGLAGWAGVSHLPALLDVVAQVQPAPSTSAVSLISLGSPAASTATGVPAAIDPAAVAAATRPADVLSGRPGATAAAGPDAEAKAARDKADTEATAESRSGARTGNRPSDLIDTGDWYLTLPTGKENDPNRVEGSALAGYHSQYFDLNKARNGVVFTAATNGATTSGSKYPRSELREMTGSQKASWDGRSGRHTMEIVQAITKTPKTKPDVIAGQIHGTTDDLMQIHLSGKRLTVKYGDGKKYVELDPNYRLGTMFDVKIESAGGQVKVWYNGALKADLPISSSTSYFKAGVYVNSNPSTGDADGVGQVVIRSLSVRHQQ